MVATTRIGRWSIELRRPGEQRMGKLRLCADLAALAILDLSLP
jgi:hypothetical protein